MIVPAMTLDRILIEIEKDFPVVRSKSSYVSKKLKRMLRSSCQSKEVSRSFEYCSPQKNQWLYKIALTKHETIISYIVYYYTKRGLRLSMPLISGQFIYANAHFISRYRERLRLDKVRTKDVMLSFLQDNTVHSFRTQEEVRPGVFKLFATMESGIGLGYFYKKQGIYKFNTFISRDMLREEQMPDYSKAQLRLIMQNLGMLPDEGQPVEAKKLVNLIPRIR